MAALAGALVIAHAAAPIRVMLLDGESGGPYHKWRLTTPVLKKALDETGLFAVDVVTAPPAGADFSGFAPDFSRYQVVVLNYDAPDERWPASLKTSFESYVKNGGGLVAVHAADNAFPQWTAFNEMIGVGGWRGPQRDRRAVLVSCSDGRVVSDSAPGAAGSHGIRVPFAITVRDAKHPIVKGLPPTWMHQGDELYARLRGPGKNMTVLATAYSDPANNGSGHDEPQLLVVNYGTRARVSHHARPRRQRDELGRLRRDAPAGHRVGGDGRGDAEGAGVVSVGDAVSYRADLAAMDPAFMKGLNPLDAASR